MYERLSILVFSFFWLPAGLLMMHSSTLVYAADSHINAQPYRVKAGVKRSDYVYSVPIAQQGAPIVEVHQSEGRFATIIGDKDIHFKTGFRVECGRGWQLKGESTLEIINRHGEVAAHNLGVTAADGDYSYMESVMDNFVETSSISPQQACNKVVQDRVNAGMSAKPFLKHGFWTKIDQAYSAELSYLCLKKTNSRRVFDDPPRNKRLRDWQPLFVHCLGNPDYGKQTAKTSKKTGATSATHADIQKALDNKQRKQDKQESSGPLRTNPVDPMIAVNKKLRYRALLADGDKQQLVSSPKLLDDFLDFGAQMAFDKKMRLVDFEIARVDRRQYYVGLWEKGQGTSLLQKPLSVSSFNKLHRTNKDKGLRLADFELVRKRGKTWVASLWRAGTAQEQFSASMTASDFKQRNVRLKQKGMYPVDIEARVDGGVIRYAALWRELEHGAGSGQNAADHENSLLAVESGFMPAVNAEEFRSYRDELASRGKQAIDIERVEKEGLVYFTGLWADGSGSSAISRPRGLNKFRGLIQPNGRTVVADLEIHPRRN